MKDSKSFPEQLFEIKSHIEIDPKEVLARVEIIVDDVGCNSLAGLCRFRKGDKGKLLFNDFYKYDHKVFIERTHQIIYFQEEELKEIPDDGTYDA